MNRTALIAVLLLIVVAAIAVPVWLITTTDRNAGLVPSFQLLANVSCACERRAEDTDGENACWRRFEQLTQTDHREPTGGTTCAPLSESTVQVGDSDEGRIILRYNVVVSRANLYLCSKEEAVAGEAIWSAPMLKARNEVEYQRAGEEGDQALIRFAEALKRGVPLTRLKPGFGCTTGNLP